MSNSSFPRLSAVRVVESPTANAFLRHLDPLSGEHNDEFVYRGQADSRWRLIPSIARSLVPNGKFDGFWETDPLPNNSGLPPTVFCNYLPWGISDTQMYLREFRQAADVLGVSLPEVVEGPRGFGEIEPNARIAAVAQHYDIPTEFIDWTRNPFAAAYFAASVAISREDISHIAVWITRKTEMNVWLKTVTSLDALGWPSYGGLEDFAQRADPTSNEDEVEVGYRFPKFELAQNSHMSAQSGELMLVAARGQTLDYRRWLGAAQFEFFTSPIQESHKEMYDDWSKNKPPRLKLPLSVDGMAEHAARQISHKEAKEWTPPFTKITLPVNEAASVLKILDRLNINGASMYPSDARLVRAAKLAKERVAILKMEQKLF